MRDAVGGTWIFAIVISITLMFAGFLVLALSYSKAYKIKNEMTSMIEKYEGLTTNISGTGSVQIINDYLRNSGYRTLGNCQVGDYGVEKLENYDITLVTETNRNNKFFYCVSYKTNYETCNTHFFVTVFYDFNLPVLGRLRMYTVTGQSNEIYKAYLKSSQLPC